MKYSGNAVVAFVLVSILLETVSLNPVIASEKPESGELSRALENLRNSDAEWRREDATYRRQRVGGNLSAVDASEYAEFVASLRRQKLEDCETVRRMGGNDALTGYDCVKTGKIGSAPVLLPPPPTTAKTEAEKLEGLDAELKRLESELDEELRQKQQALRERQHNQSAGGGGDALKSGQAGAAGEGSDQKPGNTPQWSDPRGEKSSGTGSEGQPAGSQTAKTSGETGQPQPGATTPKAQDEAGPGAGRSADKEPNPTRAVKGNSEDGSDDDIVMRQIREAAERETDPVMKEKLWNEYQKLKDAQR